MRLGVLFAGCWLGVVWTAGAQERLTLEQAVSEALQKNVGLLAERANIGIAEARIISARLRPNPVMSVSADRLDVLGTGYSDSNGGGPAEYSVRMDVPLEVAGKRARRIEVADLTRTVTELQFRNATRGLALEVANLFVDAQMERESLTLAKENLAYFEGIVEVNRARFKAGDIAEVELLRARLASLQQRNVVRVAESAWRTAVVKLQTAMGRAEPAAGLELAGELRRDGAVPGREEWRRAAVGGRPDLLALRQDLARAGRR